MSGERRHFTVTIPDWGHDHLSSEAVVAYLDDELDARPYGRAARHLAECPECAEHVVAQDQARSALRSAHSPRLPSSLMNSLRSIPHDVELPAAPAGLAMSADGELVSVLRPERATPTTTSPGPATPARHSTPPAHGRRPAVQRRIRLGAGAAVSGLALIAFGVPGIASGPPAPTADRGVFNGSVLGGSGAEAQLRLPVTPRPDPSPARVDRTAGGLRSR